MCFEVYICSSVHLFICSSVHLFICSSVHLFICSSENRIFRLCSKKLWGEGGLQPLEPSPFLLLDPTTTTTTTIIIISSYYFYYWRARHYTQVSIENRGYLFIYMWDMWGHTYVICTLILAYFCGSLSVPNFTKQNPLVHQSLPVSF